MSFYVVVRCDRSWSKAGEEAMPCTGKFSSRTLNVFSAEAEAVRNGWLAIGTGHACPDHVRADFL